MIIIAHRGARGTHPENTLLAFQAALDVGSPAIELDVHEHQGELWVIHDKWLNRTTNQIGLLSWLSTDKLKQVDAGQGEKIPTLREVFALIQGKIALNIEVKGLKNTDLLATHLKEAIQDYGFDESQLIVSSFKHEWLAQIKQARPETQIGALTGSKGLHKAKFAQDLGAISVNIALDVIDADYVNDAHQRGLKVFVYTVNQAEDWQELADIGVDGIFCDYPKGAIEYFEKQGITQDPKFTW